MRRTESTWSRSGCWVPAVSALLCVASAALPAEADAARAHASQVPGAIVYDAGSGEANRVIVGSVPGRPNAISFRDSAQIVAGPGCKPAGALVICETKITDAIPLSAEVRLLDGRDSFAGANASSLSVRVYGGEGDDALRGAGSIDILNGGEGVDMLDGGGGADTLYGNGGRDSLTGDAGLDRILGGGGRDFARGGAGRDTMSGGSAADRLYGEAGGDLFPVGEVGMARSDDLIDGGAGRDETDFLCGSCDVSLDRKRNDGRKGSSSDVRTEIVQVKSSTFDPDLAGEPGPHTFYGSGRDVLAGDGADNFLIALRGDDMLRGGDGMDVLLAGGGDDKVQAVDGERDQVECGPGRDTAVVDRVDSTSGCEIVHGGDASGRGP